MKKIYYFVLATVILVGLNILVWQLSLKLDYQLAWIAFLLVWINLVMAWLFYNKSEPIMYFFMTSSFILEALLLINYFWVQQAGRGL